MKSIKANRYKFLLIWLGYFIFNVIDFGDKGTINIFQRVSGRLFYPIFIYFLFAHSFELNFLLPRLKSYKDYLVYSAKYVLQELVPQTVVRGAGCILLSYPLNISIEWLGALHFMCWLIIISIFLGMYDQIINLSIHSRRWTVALWIWIIICTQPPVSLANLFSWPTLYLDEHLKTSWYFSQAGLTILFHFFVLALVCFLVLRERGVIVSTHKIS